MVGVWWGCGGGVVGVWWGVVGVWWGCGGGVGSRPSKSFIWNAVSTFGLKGRGWGLGPKSLEAGKVSDARGSTPASPVIVSPPVSAASVDAPRSGALEVCPYKF